MKNHYGSLLALTCVSMLSCTSLREITGFPAAYVATGSPAAYVANSDSGDVSGYTINPDTGELTSIGSVKAGQGPSSVAVARGRFVYVTNLVDNTVSGYSINLITRRLTEIPDDPLTQISDGSPFPTRGPNGPGQSPSSVAVDPSGKFAYTANLGGDNVSGYTIDRTGKLTHIKGSPFPARDGPSSVAVDPSGKFVYVTNSNEIPGIVSGYTINPDTGALTPMAGPHFPAGGEPRSVAVHPSGRFAYVANSEKSDSEQRSVSGYTIRGYRDLRDQNPDPGALKAMAGSPFTAGRRPYSVAVAVTPWPRFIPWLRSSLLDPLFDRR